MTAPAISHEILLFEIAARRGGFLAADVGEVVRAVSITPLPGAPRVIDGVIDVRGEIVPVIDLRARFGLPRRELRVSDRFVIVRGPARTIAARVDEASGIVLVDGAEVEEARRTVASDACLAGVAKLKGGLVLIYDPWTFLSAIETEALDRALAEGAEG